LNGVGLIPRREMGGILKDSVSDGVKMIVDNLPPAPEVLAFEKFLEELYKERFVTVEEVAEQVKELLRSIEKDPEQRRRLIDIRSSFCENKETYSLLAEFFETAAGIARMDDIALANYAIIIVLLAQCKPEWSRLDIERRAEILAPLYMALYHLKKYREAIQESEKRRHLRSAATLAIEALNTLEDVFNEKVEYHEN
jgi:hypothetical protein